MKKCEQIKELLSLYLDNELHENQRKMVVMHLEKCEECKRELEQIKDIVEAMNDLEEIDLPLNYESQLHEKLLVESKNIKHNKLKSFSSIIKWSSTVAAALMFLIITINHNPFERLLDKSKVAYVNDAELQMANEDERSNNKVAMVKENKEKDIDTFASSQNYMDSNSFRKALPNDELLVASESIAFNDSFGVDNTIPVPEIQNDNGDFRISNIEQYNDDTIVGNDLSGETQIMSIMLLDEDHEENLEISSAGEDYRELGEEVNITLMTKKETNLLSNLSTFVQNLDGEIIENSILTSTKEDMAQNKKYFSVIINSQNIEELISFMDDNGVLTENTFIEPDVARDITIVLKIIEK